MKINLFCFLKLVEDKTFFCRSKQEFYFTLANLVDIFKALNVLNLILQGKNINRVNDYNATNAFVAKLGLGIIEFKRKCSLFF